MLTLYLVGLMLAGPQPPIWEIPYCRPEPTEILVGGGLAVPVPREARTEVGSDIDYTCTAVHLGGNALQIVACQGPHYTYGRPSSSLLDGARDVKERRIKWPDMPADWVWDYGPVDVRGSSAEGKRWRYIGIIGASITYEGVEPGADRVLDAVLDRLCRSKPSSR
jgi:hypothetical protein